MAVNGNNVDISLNAELVHVSFKVCLSQKVPGDDFHDFEKFHRGPCCER